MLQQCDVSLWQQFGEYVLWEELKEALNGEKQNASKLATLTQINIEPIEVIKEQF